MVSVLISTLVVSGVVYSQNFKTELLNSKHNFTVSSRSDIRSTAEDESCVFCHTPHNSNPSVPLWGHKLSNVANYQLYSSSTLQAGIGQPTNSDSSKLCLSCHDGTVALGDTANSGLIPFVQGPDYKLPASSPSNIYKGIGFADDHPFSFYPVAGREIQNPPPGDPVRLDGTGKVQCVTCHDPHIEFKDPMGGFLVKSNLRSAVCTTCHTKAGWDLASHRQPYSSFNDSRYGLAQGAHTGYIGVANNGCESCHRPHSATIGQRLLKFMEEELCYKCHDGSVADNIRAEFQSKTYRHPVSTTPSVHDASEGPISPSYRLPETAAGALRHAECVDCHNPHAANSRDATPPSASGYLQNVTGIAASGNAISSSQYQYQVCFKCHADSANKPQFFDTGNSGVGFGRNPQRQTDQGHPNRYNTRLEFYSNVSWHPVINPRGLSTGINGEVPSLRPAPIGANGLPLPGRTLSPSSLIYCTDCHNNDTGRNLGVGTSPAGPHGSNFHHLLERNYAFNLPPPAPGEDSPGVPYSPNAYSLCNKCHDVDRSILQNMSFEFHREHIVQEGASCSVCHDPHGINGGNPINNSHLINFDLSIVAPDPKTGLLMYESLGFRKGRCYLKCHGEPHSPKTYGH